jgi:hypothetical protein
LFFDKWDAAEGDFTVVDIHTQPTDESGNTVGKILHTGVGKINLGVFIVRSPVDEGMQMAFVGPVMSYYEKITDNFLRLTDQDWEEMVNQNNLPARPSWTNIYLAGPTGEAYGPGLELPSRLLTGTAEIQNADWKVIAYPNPVSDELTLLFSAKKPASGQLLLYNASGILIKQSSSGYFVSGENTIRISFADLPDGLYLAKLILDNNESSVLKIIKKQRK